VVVSACWMGFPILCEGRCRGSGWHIVASGAGEHVGAQVDQIGATVATIRTRHSRRSYIQSPHLIRTCLRFWRRAPRQERRATPVRRLIRNPWSKSGSLSSPPLTSQRLKEDEDRAKYHSKAVEYRTDGVRGSLRVGNQIEEREANHQEDDEPLDPCHIGLLILRSSPQTIRPACCVYRHKPHALLSRRMSFLPRGYGER
jgi:hypothetical protein